MHEPPPDPTEQSPHTASRRHWVGFDLGGTKMLAKVFDENFRPLGTKRKRTKGHEGVEAGLGRINSTIAKALEDADVAPEQLAGIGIGCPGPIDVERGLIIEAPNLGWQKVKVRAAIEKKFQCPVVVLNDVDAGVYGEYRFGAGKQARSVVGVFPGTGIGGGCVYEGRIIQGRHITCMEVGHIPYMSDGPLTASITPGSLEAVASRLAISAAAAQESFRGQAPHLRSLAGTDLSDIRSGVLAESIKHGDKAIERLVRSAAVHIGRCIGGLVHLLAPEVIVLGGGLVEAMPDIFTKTVADSVAAFILPSFRDTYRVAAAQLGNDAAVLGAAAWARTIVEDRRA